MTDTELETRRYVKKLRESYLQFKDCCGSRVERSILQLLENSLTAIHKIERDKNLRKMENILTTITHGDSHRRNFLYPRTDGLALIADWQFWNVGIGTYDLRHLLGSLRKVALRQHQQELVHHYYQLFAVDPGNDYSWEDCWLDYHYPQQGIIDNLFMAVWQDAGFNWKYDRWIPTLHTAVENYYDFKFDLLKF
ncbi:MAG: oxidoreductase family protein [Anaerolineales bacterium]|nr:oxidoreductase family protein [Anaerolineales bacterium]